MPTISSFYGILIQMFFTDHAPPHFHVKYGEHKGVIDIKKQTYRGQAAAPGTEPVLDWAELHQNELLEDWQLCQEMQHPKPITPLE